MIIRKVSEIDLDYLVDYLKLDDPDEDDRRFIQTCLDAAKSYVRSQTSLDDERIDTHEDITIAVLVLVQDAIGQDTITHEKGKRIWATVRSVRGGEYYDALKLSPEVSYILYTRYREDIHPDTILLYHDKKLEVKYVTDMEEQNVMLEIQCTEYKKKRADYGWNGI